MRKSITYTIEPRLNYMTSDCYIVCIGKTQLYGKSAWITGSRNRMEKFGTKLPPNNYKVTYTLAPKTGEFYIESEDVIPFMRRVVEVKGGPEHNQIINCLLPTEWRGLRFNRKAVAL